MGSLFRWFRSLFNSGSTPLVTDRSSSDLSAKPVHQPHLLFEPFTIPVLVIHYLPVKAGQIDISITGDVGGSLEQIRRHCVSTTQRVVEALEQGSTYHGYKDPLAQPSLRYQIIDSIEFLEPLPTWPKPGHRVPMTDYNAILKRIDIHEWVEKNGIREVWLWGYHGGVVDLWESNMAGPWGDISNSDRDLHDLPILSKSYTVYHYNYQRGPSEAVEDHMHQNEAIFRQIDPQLFWERFVGKPGEGRCGWAHYPPNGVSDYDWRNPNYVLTDIEDWRPDGGGEKIRINCNRWNGDSLQWFIYWMQNVPGANNGLSFRGRPLTNWWNFIGDWDGAMEKRMGLVEK